MPEQFKPYNFDQAQNEAEKMKAKIESGEAKDYKEAEKSIEDEEDFDEVKNSKKGEWKTMEIPRIGEVRYFEKTVMFPERIVRETGGVKGYVRKIISEDEFYKAQGIDKKKYDKFMKKYRETKYEDLTCEDMEIYEDYNNKKRKRTKLVFSYFSDGNFPNMTFNHVMDGVWNGGGDSKGDFFKDKGVLQKIFPIEDDINNRGILSARENFSIYSKNDHECFPIKNYDTGEKRKKIFCDKNIQKSHYFLNTKTSQGLSVAERGLLGFYNINKIAVGFGSKNKVFKEYLEKILLFRKNHKLHYNDDSSVYERDHIDWSINTLLSKTSEHFNTSGYGYGHYDGERDHPRIPIMINYPGIPRLKWCHADYIFIKTKRGMNILEMIT